MHFEHREMLIWHDDWPDHASDHAWKKDVVYEISHCIFIMTSKGISSNSTVISEHASVNNNTQFVSASLNTQNQLFLPYQEEASR